MGVFTKNTRYQWKLFCTTSCVARHDTQNIGLILFWVSCRTIRQIV
jgi:hypothetical protein